MSCILFVTAPALGHVSRLLSIADELNKIDESEIVFAAPSDFEYEDLIVESGYNVHLLTCHYQRFNGQKIDLGSFSGKLEKLIVDLNPTAIVYDCPPLHFLAVMHWPKKIPKILVTNVFLTRVSEETALSKKHFRK